MTVRLLIVDDHPIWRDAVARDLTDAGFDVVGTADDGPRALRVAAATRPDVVLLDLHLPTMSGVEVVRRLCIDPPEEPRPYVLVLSASGERQDVLDAVKAGATGYLVKSAKPAELVSRRGADGPRRSGVHTGSGRTCAW